MQRDHRWAKGHGTGNDFVLVTDLNGTMDVTPSLVTAVCHRRTGIGADGLLRVVPTRLCAEVADQADSAEWFMDYRNADGSVAEMCGNGIRVFARYLVREGFAAPGGMNIATRGGVRTLSVPAQGDITVSMGTATTPMLRAMPVVSVAEGGSWNAVAVLVPNPHAVTFVDSLDDAGALRTMPEVAPPAMFPDGANVEFVEVVAADHVRMRVFERGVGETMSCGTGAVAVAWAARRQGVDAPDTVRVDVPGGMLMVTEHADGTLDLTGPAEIVSDVEPDPQWLTTIAGADTA